MPTLPLILLLLGSVCAGAAADCEFPIRRSRVLSSWQSSFYDWPTCFYNRSHGDEENTVRNKTPSYRFFHSADKSRADGGFHWFAVQLNESVLIRSVTVKGREDSAADTYLRAVGIEIWTSNSTSALFSGEHCSSMSMSTQFNGTRDKWSRCGTTVNKTATAPGENFTVSCAAEVRHFILRRIATDALVGDHMSFADLILNTVKLELSAPGIVTGDSAVNVSCSLSCPRSGLVQLCSPSGNCSTAQSKVTALADRVDSGKYTCNYSSISKSATVLHLCDFRVRKKHTTSAWQSSSFLNSCFHSKSESLESEELNDKARSYNFFHSDGKSQSRSGFHWFAVKLRKPVLVRSVTVKGREDNERGTYARAKDIEVFVSNRSSQIFFGDHCSSTSISAEFHNSLSDWTRCGKTQKEGAISAGEIFTVDCASQGTEESAFLVWHLLLRRNASEDDGYTSFADLGLQTLSLRAESPELLAENSSFTVSCSRHCTGSQQLSTSSSDLRLCPPNGSCISENRLEVAQAQPGDSGVYTCRAGPLAIPTAVTVLSSTPHQVVAENSSLSLSCSLHCGNATHCADFGPLGRPRLCYPSNSCIDDATLRIDAVAAAQSGSYECRLDSAVAVSRVSVLTLTPDQVVAEKSSLRLDCVLHFKDTADSQKLLQLFFPNGSLDPGSSISIARARPSHSGLYRCRHQSVEVGSFVTVLSSSPDQLLPVSSQFSVRCSLHCNASDLSCNSSHLQLCPPTGSCVRGQLLNVTNAQPWHSGNYSCRFGRAVKSASVSVVCKFAIRRSRILASWQSSYFTDQSHTSTCFHPRDAEVDRQAGGNWWFFHSSEQSQADGGFHWFAVQLAEPVLIRSVTVVGRSDAGEYHDAYKRVLSIEIFTSSSSRAIFSGDHCASKNMSRLFNESSSLWRPCGQTRKEGTISPGEIFTVSCVAEVRQLLLRRAANAKAENDGYMNFADLIVETGSIRVASPQLVAESSSFSVSCELHCNVTDLSTDSGQMRICSPDGRCSENQTLLISKAQPVHSGKYTCRLGSSDRSLSTTVSVLSSSPSQVVAMNSELSVSCWLHCNSSEQCPNLGDLQLILPNGSHVSGKNLRIVRAQPGNAGEYTCAAGNVTKRTAVALLSATPDQVVAHGSKLSVNCSLLYPDSKAFHELQVCLPNGSCTRKASVEILSSTPQDAGVYKCKLNSTEVESVVAVLSSTPDLTVVANTSFTVECSLHCGSESCRVQGQVQLCFPNGSCSETGENRTLVEILRAEPQHSGNYTCRAGSAAKSASVTVLYPPSNVSITLLNSHNCTIVSDIIVSFSSSESHPLPEHRCHAVGGGVIKQSTLLSTKTSENGSRVSLWRLVSVGDRWLDASRGTVHCAAAHNGSTTSPFSYVSENSASWTCGKSKGTGRSQSSASLLAALGGISAATLVAALVIFLTTTLRKARFTQPTVETLSLKSLPLASCDMDSDLPTVAPSVSYFSYNEPECNYLTVAPSAAARAGAVQSQDSDSDCTEYTEIATDGI